MIRVIRSETYTYLYAGVWTPLGAPITADEAGICTEIVATITPEVAGTVDAGLLQVGIRRGLSVVHTVPAPYQIYRDITATTDYAAPPAVQRIPVRWRVEPGDQVVVYGGSGNGCTIYAVLSVEPATATLAARLPPLPGDHITPAATWAMAAATSRRRWPALRYLLGALLALALLAGCATTRVLVTCTVTSVGPRGNVTMQCTPTADGASRARGDVQLLLPADLVTQEQQQPPQ